MKKTLVVEGHLEGTVSQIFLFRSDFYFIKSKKLSLKNGKKFPIV